MESWRQVSLFYDGDSFFNSLIRDIRNAQKSVMIESYIFNWDRLTQSLLQELKSARSRGVDVKIVVDGFGAYYQIPHLDKWCSDNQIEFRVFHPLPYPMLWARNLFVKYALWRGSFLRKINRRTHRKMTIIDEEIAYVGSMNFAEYHCAEYVGDAAWRDTGARVIGPPVQRLIMAFQISYLRTYIKGLMSWVNRWKDRSPPYSNFLRLNTTQKMRRQMYQDLLRKFLTAESRIYITTAYFLPKRAILRAMIKAADKGVDIKIIIPGKSDVPLVKWAAFFIIQWLVKKKISIYEYQPSILHAKTMIIDNEAHVGSFNLNHRSLLHDLEVEVILNDQSSLESMIHQWNVDLKNSKPMTQDDVKNPSWFSRQLYRIAFKLRYML
ncbi:cardiolipin synthetase [Bdellovibrio bacteriovorus W]|nr:cardiolipin synthetase [Bdellovibrio bacteriovorus W]